MNKTRSLPSRQYHSASEVPWELQQKRSLKGRYLGSTVFWLFDLRQALALQDFNPFPNQILYFIGMEFVSDRVCVCVCV